MFLSREASASGISHCGLSVLKDMNLSILLMFLCIYSAHGINFDTDGVIEMKLRQNETVKGSYFGYSLLLQTGEHPRVIVGSPKQTEKTGGAVFACDVFGTKECTKYSLETSNFGTFNGNFLGVTIDGDDNTGMPFFACAPRTVVVEGIRTDYRYYLKGVCMYQSNSSVFTMHGLEVKPLQNELRVSKAFGQYYYNFGYAQAGIDAIYDKDASSIIMGASGVKNWNGAVVLQSLKILSDHVIIPETETPDFLGSQDYLGYKVGKGSVAETAFIIAGAPRSEFVLGKVKLFNDNELYRSFSGEEVGAYFGAAVLAEDVNNDGSDDLFIGAPMTAGSTYDEGCVYYYKNTFGSSIKLVGLRKKGGRFGSSIVALGDIDLDSYNDIAISAPFEDDGVGAVYIFRGGFDGIERVFSQRLSPASFAGSPKYIRGFGLGLSRGNDIDNNGHNDLAIGAYRSGNVFVIPTKSVIDFRASLESDLDSITSNDNQMTLKYCVIYSPRQRTSSLDMIQFSVQILLDTRVKGTKMYSKLITAHPDHTVCNQIDVKIEKSFVDLTPFKINMKTEPLGKIFAEGNSVIEKSISYIHGCGDDNICQTGITIDVLPNIDSIISGVDKAIEVKVSADNVGEPGYQCQLFIQMPKVLQLRQEKQCSYENSSYICPFATKLGTEEETASVVIFDVLSMDVSVQTLDISFEVKCMGENVKNPQNITIKVIVKTSPFIKGESQPESFESNDENAEKDEEILIRNTFTLGNYGPSPIKSDINILVPMVKVGDDDLFHFVEAKGTLRDIQVPCYPSNETKVYEQKYNVSAIVKTPLSKTIVLDCFQADSKCLELVCRGNYLYGSAENAKFSLNLKMRTNMLAKFFKSHDKTNAALITTAFLFNGTRIDGYATMMFSVHFSTLPNWVYIVAAVLGILLLALLIYFLYKCHFFDRHYRDKMNDERLMDQPIETEAADMPNAAGEEE